MIRDETKWETRRRDSAFPFDRYSTSHLLSTLSTHFNNKNNDTPISSFSSSSSYPFVFALSPPRSPLPPRSASSPLVSACIPSFPSSSSETKEILLPTGWCFHCYTLLIIFAAQVWIKDNRNYIYTKD